MNGPAVTVIQGNPVIGNNAVRGVYLARGAMLSGFTLTQGAATLGGNSQENAGGGIYCEDSSATVSNCIITGNATAGGGGGALSCVLNNCLLFGNVAGWSGGGADASTLDNCTVVNNSAGYYGGAFDGCSATNCIVYYNPGDNGVNSTSLIAAPRRTQAASAASRTSRSS